MKQFGRIDRSCCQPLLMRITRHRIELRQICLKSVRPDLRSYDFLGFIECRTCPGKCHALHADCGKVIKYPLPRFAECLIDGAWQSWMLFRKGTAHANAVHNREEARAPIIVFFDLAVIDKQSFDLRVAEHAGRERHHQGADLTGHQHRRKCLVGTDRLDPDMVRQINLHPLTTARLFKPAGAPGHVSGTDTVIIGQHAAHPKRCGLLILLDANLLANQIAGLGNAGGGVDVDRGMAKNA